MLKSKRGFLASEILEYHVIDRHSKKIGKVTDLLINSVSYLIDHIVVGKDHVVSTSLIAEDNSAKKLLFLSESKDRLIPFFKKTPPKKCVVYSELRKSAVYDLTGEKLGPIKDIAYHPGLRVDLLIEKDLFDFLLPEFLGITADNICQFNQAFVTLCVPMTDLKLVNFTGCEELFAKYRQQPEGYEGKKRYVIVEAPTTTVSFFLQQREDSLQEVAETVFIEELDSSSGVKLLRFVKLFNTILATSPDSYIPISIDDALKYFGHGTFIAYQSHQAIGYSHVTIEDQDETGQRIGAIAGIGVHPSYRGKSVALALFDRSLEYLIENNADKIQADIFDLNLPSLKLFSSLGFQEIGETHLA
ncbi:MAG: GNAT family N-acetyltransferase [Candidatus Thorarchaeota archaeon]